MRSAFGAAVLVAALAACDSTTAPQQDPTEWNASLAGGEGFDDVGGGVLVTSTGSSFQATIELEGLVEGEYEWEVAAGTCEDPGAPVGPAGVYGRLTGDGDGKASGSASVSESLQPSAAYHAALYFIAEVDDEEVRIVVACGDLERQ